MLYEKLLKACICDEVEKLINTIKNDIEKYSYNSGIPYDIIEKQVRLHLPCFEKSYFHMGSTFFKDYIVPILNKRFESFKEKYADYLNKCGADLIPDCKGVLNKQDGIKIKYENGVIYNVLFSEVGEDNGKFIESKLHYLRSPRENAICRYGLFIKGHEMPICYASFCDVDRKNKIAGLEDYFGNEISGKTVIEMSRVYGFGRLPYNSISMLIDFASNKIKRLNKNYIITAVNPFIGFNGKSIMASGFIPYVLRPVAYSYSPDNLYKTRRQGIQINTGKWDTPPNILYVKKINGKNQLHVKEYSEIKKIPPETT